MLKKLTWKKINEYLDNGLLIKSKHPSKDLWILNYSRTCQFEKAWDDILLMCRGLVVDSDGKIIARCLKKFFNREELMNDPNLGIIPTNESYEIFDKKDGSLGILFYYEDEWILASRGSFISEQAIKGKEILKKYHSLNNLNKYYTYLFEIIY